MSTRISRATFLKTLAGCGLAAVSGKVYLEWFNPSPQFPCRMLGPSREIGHLLRDSKRVPPSVAASSTKTRVTIIGGGMAGLSAAWWLRKHGVKDFVVLELEQDVGGNSSSGKNDYGAYPWGAHYVPIANPESTYVRQLFEELGIITDVDHDGLAAYDELMLCHEPQERLYKDGAFHDGLVPKRGLQKDELEEMSRFFQAVQKLRGATGSDGKLAFTIPLDLSSQDPEFLGLDRISMSQWLKDNDFKTRPLHWYVNYCCRDDYGATLDNVSAWAGIHYFAGRRGVASNAEPNSVITWPQGNGYLVERLKAPLHENIKVNSLVTEVKRSDNGIFTTLMNSKSRQFEQVVSDYVIVATPRFVAARILAEQAADGPSLKDLNYAPWMVANISLRDLPDARGQSAAWDNVSYYSDSLGYVMANHQDITTRAKPNVITYYYPLSENIPKVSRQELYNAGVQKWSERIIADLEKMHPNIASEVISMDLWPWGHGMISPAVGFIWGESRKRMKKSDGKIVFAHSDMSGMSNFEEAQYHGVEAAKLVLRGLEVKDAG